MSLEYEPSSIPLHNSAKWLSLGCTPSTFSQLRVFTEQYYYCLRAILLHGLKCPEEPKLSSLGFPGISRTILLARFFLCARKQKVNGGVDVGQVASGLSEETSTNTHTHTHTHSLTHTHTHTLTLTAGGIRSVRGDERVQADVCGREKTRGAGPGHPPPRAAQELRRQGGQNLALTVLYMPYYGLDCLICAIFGPGRRGRGHCAQPPRPTCQGRGNTLKGFTAYYTEARARICP